MKRIISIIEDFCKNFGSFITLNELKRLWLKNSTLSETAFYQELQILKSTGDIEIEYDRIYLSYVHRQKIYAAERLHELMALPPLKAPPLPPILHVDGITLTAEQRSGELNNHIVLNDPFSL